MKPIHWITLSILASALTGCTVGPNYHAPRETVPGTFSRGSTSVPTKPIDVAHWWQTLHDPELDSLLDRAVSANLDLQIAAARLQQARALEAVYTGGSLPDLEFSAAAGRGSGNNSTKGRISSPLNAGSNSAGLREITQVIGFDATWELDLFGNLRREAEAARADTAAAAEQRNFVLVTLLADVARQYGLVRTLQDRMAIANQAIAATQRSFDLATIRLQRGLVNALDLELARRELATTQAALDPLQAELAAAERSVAVLLGRYPEELRAELDRPEPMPMPPAELATGLPGELLRRRPDVREAEAQLMASNARIGVATSALYPQLFLSGGVGVQGQGLGNTPVSWQSLYSIGPGVRWPIFDFGLIDSEIQVQDQRTRAQLAQYRKTIISAVAEVDDALTNYDAERSRSIKLQRAVDAAQRAVDLATRRYNRGLTDFLNVLDAERALYGLQDQAELSRAATLTQFIAVCKSLGGGWEGFAPPPPLQNPQPAVLALARDALSNRSQ